MSRLALVLAFVAVALAEESQLPSPEVLTWQFDAQERERSMQRQIDYQSTRAQERARAEECKNRTAAVTAPAFAAA